MIEDVKLITETAKGTLIRVSATIEYKDGRIWFLKSPFSLKDEIKSMKGSRWHGYEEDNPRKIWSVEDCERNRFQLGWMQGEDVYEWFDRDLVEHEFRDFTLDGVPADPMPHQFDLANAGLTYHYQIFAAEMGCVDGDAIVHINRAGRGMKIPLSKLHYKFHGGVDRGRSWNSTIPTYIRSLCGDTLRLNRVMDVLDKGVKPVVLVTLASGKTLRVTPDHEICVGYDEFSPAESLKPGDPVFTNGTHVDKDGYVRVHGVRHHRESTHGVYEHILVAEEKLGRPIRRDEAVHPKNGIRHDNRPENLEVLPSHNAHASLHAREGGFRHLSGGRSINGGEVWFVPKVDTVVSVEFDGEAHVYDVVCADPHRNFVANGVVVHNCGKTLAAQMMIEKAGGLWYWIGPKTSLPNMEREFKRWGFLGTFTTEDSDLPTTGLRVLAMTYEGLVRRMNEWKPGDVVPRGLICDESSRCKTATSQRSQAVMKLATLIRQIHGLEDGYVVEMSGTPSPKSPIDWWSQCEIAWPGFLKEGSPKALEQRCAFLCQQQFDSGVFQKRVGWKDDENKCAVCGEHRDEGPHELDGIIDPKDFHDFVASKNEVAYLHERLKGLVQIKHKKDCLTLPDKRYRRIFCKPTASTLRVAQAISSAAPSAIVGMTLLRELSDGFQYREVESGTGPCPHCPNQCGTVEEWFDPQDEERAYKAIDMLTPELVDRLEKRSVPCPRCNGLGKVTTYTRIAKEIPCPKDAALKELLEECEETGRIVIFAGFTGAVDRIVRLCHKEKWHVVRCDGGNFRVLPHDAESPDVSVKPLDYWADLASNARVAFVANPESGGMSLTLTESRMAVYWSNTFKPEYRVQSEDRIHRKGADENIGPTIVDLIHLPTDKTVLEVIQANRKLELMTLGEVTSALTTLKVAEDAVA